MSLVGYVALKKCKPIQKTIILVIRFNFKKGF